MAKEQFFHSESADILKTLDEAARRSGVSRGQVFEDFLHMSLCALSGGQLEEQYMATVKKHSEGKKGKRGCDAIAQAFAMLVDAMEKTRQDILGDLFQGGITILKPRSTKFCSQFVDNQMVTPAKALAATAWTRKLVRISLLQRGETDELLGVRRRL